MWYRSESGVKPQEVQEGKSVVYIRKNITEEQREVDG